MYFIISFLSLKIIITYRNIKLPIYQINYCATENIKEKNFGFYFYLLLFINTLKFLFVLYIYKVYLCNSCTCANNEYTDIALYTCVC